MAQIMDDEVNGLDVQVIQRGVKRVRTDVGETPAPGYSARRQDAGAQLTSKAKTIAGGRLRTLFDVLHLVVGYSFKYLIFCYFILLVLHWIQAWIQRIFWLFSDMF
ncbi:hypothetical protein [Nevskia soli]|uniref:hypothetical protein n=1 Tax=Nevskia soli TaxID=418856 RepID=UPI0004A7639E|nr:hypothetical protein [Nevskia soli]